MKLSIVFFTILASFNLMANQASENLKVEIIGKSSVLLIPASNYSCLQIATISLNGDGAVLKNYFSMPNPKISWEGDKKSLIQIDKIRVAVNSKQTGAYECIHGGTHLRSLYFRNSVDSNGIIYSTLWDATLGLFTVSSTNELKYLGYQECNLLCGGLNVEPHSWKFTVEGKWEVFGVEKKYDSTQENIIEENPIYKTGPFQLENAVEL